MNAEEMAAHMARLEILDLIGMGHSSMASPEFIAGKFRRLEAKLQAALLQISEMQDVVDAACAYESILGFDDLNSAYRNRREVTDAFVKAVGAFKTRLPQKPKCEHEWVDARNKVVTSGEVCLKCNSIRAGNVDEVAPITPEVWDKMVEFGKGEVGSLRCALCGEGIHDNECRTKKRSQESPMICNSCGWNNDANHGGGSRVMRMAGKLTLCDACTPTSR